MTSHQTARSPLLKKIPLNWRTVFFALCASGAFSIPAFFILHVLGYRGTELNDAIGWAVVLLAIAETICLPVASIFFYKIEPSLALLGIVGFLVVLCAGLGFPALK